MSAPIGNFQFELEQSLQAAKSRGLLRKITDEKSEDVFIKTYGQLVKINDIEWVTVFFDNCHKLNIKASENASGFRNEGNRLFQRKIYKEAVSKYTQAVLNGPKESEELALAYGNRSAALYRIGSYQECLADIEEALKCGFPSSLCHKLLLRKAQCMSHLGQHEDTQLCLEVLQKKLSGLDLDASKKDVILKEISEIQSLHKSNVCKNKQEIQNVRPEVSYGCNPVLVQASSAVVMSTSPAKGRYLTACKDMKAGDTLIVERPFAAVLLPDHYPTHCHHCFQKLSIAYPCRQCTMVRYCSPDCETSSWNVYHHVECRYLQLLHSVGIAHLSLRIILVAGLKYLLDFKAEQNTIKVKDTMGLDENGQYTGNYQPVYNLMTHCEDMTVEDLFQYTMTAELLLKILQHSGWLGNKSGLTDRTDEESCIIGGLLLRHILQLVCNAHAITELQCNQQTNDSIVEEKSQVRIATAIYPTASLMNHSCDPTIISSFCKNILVVRAVKDVKTGEEIFNCYGPHYKRMGWSERQQCLKEQYFFECQCSPCVEGEASEALYMSYSCNCCSGPLMRTPSSQYVCQQCKQVGTADVKSAERAAKLFQHGLDCLHENRIKGAIEVLEECHTIRRSILYKHNKLLADAQDCLARCYAMTGNFKKALKYLRESVKTVEIMFGENSIEFANELQKLSETLIGAQDWKEALSTNERACEIFERNYGKSHDTVQELTASRDKLLQILCS
ncbi:SET and MYND domain-containing protein 4-like [Ruditapes philippinarum]|uniref:SET and MYND domain-containing protein 4-like n=1 Tax=Ruditapes philippinarum TaxID=129788 RepID=UPI00295A5DF3|nr:SET and MYND domain-containing protein 4-like [Ruditapes philippinarum]